MFPRKFVKLDYLLPALFMEYTEPKPIPRRRQINSKASTTLLIMAILLVLSTIITTYYRNQKNRQSVGWISHTHNVIEASRELLSSIGAAEAMNRDLILSTDTTELMPEFRSALTRVDTLPNVLRRMTLDNPPQTVLLDKKIIPLTSVQTQRWMENIQQSSVGPKNYILSPADRNRNALLDSIYQVTSKFIENEEVFADNYGIVH